MTIFNNFGSPLRRRQERKTPDDTGFLLNETAIWLVVIAIILGLGGYFGLRFISQTQSAAARQVLDRAVAVADSVYSQQYNGKVSFLADAGIDTSKINGTSTTQTTYNTEGAKVIAEWNAAGEGLEFKWWPAQTTTTPTGTGTGKTWHQTLLDDESDAVWLYVNMEPVTGNVDGITGDETIPAGQMIRMASADDDDNTYCVIYIRQVLPGDPDQPVAAQKLIGTGYQSVRKATPTGKQPTDNDNTDYADCGMEGQFNKTKTGTVMALGAGTSADKFDTFALAGSDTTAELPGIATTSSRLSDPTSR